MFAEIDLDTPVRECLVCPKAAIQERDGHKIVFVITATGVKEREITIGSANGDLIEVLSGLEAGQKVATKGSSTLRPKASKASDFR